MTGHATEFELASRWLSDNSDLSLSNEQKLRLYALYKIASLVPTHSSSAPSAATAAGISPVKAGLKRPGIWDFAGRAKYDTWAALADEYERAYRSDETGGERTEMNDGLVDWARERAQREYVDMARSLGWQQQGLEDGSTGAGSREGGGKGMRYVSMMANTDDQLDVTSTKIHDLALNDDSSELERALDAAGQPHSAQKLALVNARDSEGYTALHLAADRGLVDVVKVLVRHGADITLQDPDEQTALSLAKEARHYDIVTLLSTASE